MPESAPSVEDLQKLFDGKRDEISAALKDAMDERAPGVKAAIRDAVDSNSDDLKGALSGALASLQDSPLKAEMTKALDGANTEEVKAAIKKLADSSADTTKDKASKTLDDLMAKAAQWGSDGSPSSPSAPASVETFTWPWQKKPQMPESAPSVEDLQKLFDGKRDEISAALKDAMDERAPGVKAAIRDAVDSNSDDLKGALSGALASLQDSPLKAEMTKALDGANTEEVKAAIKKLADSSADTTKDKASKTLDDLMAKAAQWGSESAGTGDTMPLVFLRAPSPLAHAQAVPAPAPNTAGVMTAALVLVIGVLGVAGLTFMRAYRKHHASAADASFVYEKYRPESGDAAKLQAVLLADV